MTEIKYNHNFFQQKVLKVVILKRIPLFFIKAKLKASHLFQKRKHLEMHICKVWKCFCEVYFI